MKNKILLFIFFILVLKTTAQELPHYKLNILPAYLDSMQANLHDEIYCPAQFVVNNTTYNVKVKYKGSSSRIYPKKSWGIDFGNDNNYFGVSRINLHSDYKDYSFLRNFLILKLFNHFNIAAPQIQHTTLDVNGSPFGIYTQVEQIDNDFLQRNSLETLALYKANNHGGLMAPSVKDDDYHEIWQDIAGTDKSFTGLKKYLNQCLYWTKDEFNNNIENTVDIDNYITFFAIHFVFTSMDNFTKNIFLNKNSFTNKYEFVPWDNEGSFGNSAMGVFDSTLVSYKLSQSYTPEYQVVFNRLLENPKYMEMFTSKVNEIITHGYTFLNTLIDNTYPRIKPAVYADTKKEATNEDFENAILKIKWFMATRAEFLRNNVLNSHYPLYNFYCSNPFPSPDNPMITFRVTSPIVQPVDMFFADSVNYSKRGEPFKFSRLLLYDDGQHDDLLPNDLIYGNTKNSNDFVSNVVPYTFTASAQNYPQNGVFYIDYFSSKSYAINKGNHYGNVSDYIKLGQVSRFNGKSFVQLYNSSNTHSVNLSYFHIRTDNSFDDFMFDNNTIVAPNETIYIAPNETLSNHFFPNNRAFQELYFNFNDNDSIHLLSSFLTPVVSMKLNALNVFTTQKHQLVINEINFKSGSERPTGDWVEIFNNSDIDVDLSDWKFCDNNNCYKFPRNYKINKNDYLVVAEDLSDFSQIYPELTNAVGDTDFGLSSSGEYILLYDNLGQLIDSVNYKLSTPWPSNASGTGHTLELKDYLSDNNDGANWYVDNSKFGSPGKKNYLTSDLAQNSLNPFSIYPNPAIDKIFIQNAESGSIVEIISLQGVVLLSQTITTNNDRQINISEIQKGIYLVKVTFEGNSSTTKLIVK